MNEEDLIRSLSGMLVKRTADKSSEFDKQAMVKSVERAMRESIAAASKSSFEKEYLTMPREELKNAKLISEYSLESFNKNAVAEFVSAIDENDLIPKLVHDGYQAGAGGTYGLLPYSPYSDEGSSWMAGWLSGHIDYEQEIFKRNERMKREADKLKQEQMRAFFSQDVYTADRTGEQKIAAGLNELLRSNKGRL